jgi:hypothetical protein
VHACLDDLVIALYVTVDELVEPRRGPGCRPRAVGRRAGLLGRGPGAARLSLRTPLAAGGPWPAGAPVPLRVWAGGRQPPAAPRGPLVAQILGALAVACPSWCDQWRLLDATPVPCGTSRETVKRSELAGWAGYGWDASHHRFYWGLKL